MCRQEAKFRPGIGLSALWRAGRRCEEPLPVPSPAGRGEGTGKPKGAGPDWCRDPPLAESRITRVHREGKIFGKCRRHKKWNGVVVKSWVTVLFFISLASHVVSWCLRCSGSEAAAPSGNPGQDRGQRWTSVSAPAVCCQPAALTAGDGDWTVAFPGKWTPRLPWSTLSSRYGACRKLTSVDWKGKLVGWSQTDCTIV